MIEVKKIQCPACGSNSTFKLFDSTYQCNYCSSSFLVEDNIKQERQQPEVQVDNTPIKPFKSYYIIIGVIVFLCISTASVFTSSLIFSDGSEYSSAKSYPPGIRLTYGFVGSKGPVIWIIHEEYRSADSIWYELHVIDPKTNLMKGTQRIIPVFKLNDNLDFNKKISDQFRQYRDVAYNISDDNGFVGYNIYTGEVEVNVNTLTKNFQELKGGILKVSELPSENAYHITTTLGDVFVFNPNDQTIVNKKEKDTEKGNLKKKTVHSKLYLSDGLKKHLYLFTKTGDGFPIVFGGFVQESELGKSKRPKGNNVKDVFGNINIEKISDKDFFRGTPMFRDNDGNLILMYKTDLSENASVVLESISDKGETKWRMEDSLFWKLPISVTSENLQVNFVYSVNELIIYLHDSKNQYIGIDIATGKKLWEFNPKQYLEDNWSAKIPN